MTNKEIGRLLEWMSKEEYEKVTTFLKNIYTTEINNTSRKHKKNGIEKYQRALYKNATKYELKFKEILVNNGIRFYFQKIFKVPKRIGNSNYIVDFYIPQNNVVIEIDGSQHNKLENIQKDSIRTEALLSMGVSRVIRFSNEEVNNNSEKISNFMERLKKEQEGLKNLMA